MVVDASILLAILLREPDAGIFQKVLLTADRKLVSMSSVMEASIRMMRLGGADGDRDLDPLVALLQLEPVEIDLAQTTAARIAYARFGRGMGHPAQLNFGDCFSYALATTRNLPLLYKGGDFSHTDVVSAL